MRARRRPPTPTGCREAGRISARRKTDTILRMLRGEPLDSLASELGVMAATLVQWRERFLPVQRGYHQPGVH